MFVVLFVYFFFNLGVYTMMPLESQVEKQQGDGQKQGHLLGDYLQNPRQRQWWFAGSGKGVGSGGIKTCFKARAGSMYYQLLVGSKKDKAVVTGRMESLYSYMGRDCKRSRIGGDGKCKQNLNIF